MLEEEEEDRVETPKSSARPVDPMKCWLVYTVYISTFIVCIIVLSHMCKLIYLFASE